MGTPTDPPVVGLLPAAGYARRLPGLQGSKEVVPVRLPGESTPPRPAALHALRGLARAGVRRAYLVLRAGKWDIPACLGDGRAAGLQLAYLCVEPTPDIPHTLDRAYAFVRDARVALGLPDTIVRPKDAWAAALERQRAGGAEIVLGLFPASRPGASDTVEIDDAGRVRSLAVKDPDSPHPHVWGLAVWTPVFTDYLHEFLSRPRPLAAAAPGGELYPGHVFAAALRDGLRVEGIPFPDGVFLDTGAPESPHRASD